MKGFARKTGRPGRSLSRAAGLRRGRRESTLRLIEVEWLEARSLRAAITEYPIPTTGSGPQEIAAGPDGALWFTESSANKIGRITTGGVVTEYTIPTANSSPDGITTGPDGAIWFVEYAPGANKVGRLTTSGVFSEYPIPTANSQPARITTGPDGNLWFTEYKAGSVARITPGGQITEFSVNIKAPLGITAGPDGALWFIDNQANAVGRITTAGAVVEYPIPSGNADPRTITVGSDGALWFTEYKSDRNIIGRVTTAGVFTQFPLPNGSVNPIGIAPGSDGALWFTENGSSGYGIGRITTSGAMTEYPIAGGSSVPPAITRGPDNALWFTDPGTNQIGTILPDTPAAGSLRGVAAVEGTVSNQVVADFSGINPNGVYSATIDWGDGSTSAGSVTINGSTGTLSVSGSHAYGEEGPYPVTVALADGAGPLLTISGTATAADAALSVSAVSILTNESSAFSGVVGSLTDANPNAIASDFTATISWGDGQTSSGTVAADGRGGFTVSGSNTYAEEGTYPVSVSVRDAGGASASAGATATIADPPLTAAAQPVSAVEGSAFSGVVGSFTDANPFATAADFTATIAWGDGHTSTGTVAADGRGGFTVSGSNTYAEEGAYAVSVAVRDAGGASATAGTTAAVADVALTASAAQPVSAVEGLTFSGVVGSFTDAKPGSTAADFTATVSWGDGQSTSGTIAFDAASGRFTVSGANTYAEEGSYSVSVAVADVGGSTASVGFTATATDAPLSAGAVNTSATEGVPFTAVVARFTDADPAATAANFTATIAWGDGQISPGVIGYDPVRGAFTVTGSHTYVAAGAASITVVIHDAGGSSATVASNLAPVGDAPLSGSGVPVSVVEATAFSGVVATFTDGASNPSLSYFSATITWGDGQTSPGTVARDGRGGFTVSGSHTYVSARAYPLNVAIQDVGGSSVSTASTATVADAPLSASGVNVAAVEGAAFSGDVGSFTDANPFASAADFTATISWGDGQTSTGTVAADGRGGFTVSGANTYAEEGAYAVSVAVRDAGGAAATAGTTAAVADMALTASAAPVSAVEGSAFSGVVGSFTDANPFATAADFTATISWGDGHTSTGTVAADGRGGFTVSGANTYAEEGAYAVSVAVRDAGGAAAGAGGPANVADAPITASTSPISAAEGSGFSGVVGSFTDANATATAADFTATIAWGDGHTSTGTVAADGRGGFTVSGSNTYAEEGSYTVTVAIGDAGGASSTAGGMGIVTDAALTAVGQRVRGVEGASVSGVVAAFADANPNATSADFTASIDWGDGTTSAGLVSFDPVAGGFTVTGSHTYAEEGSYQFTVRVSDAGGSAGSASGGAAVADAALTADAPPVAAVEGSAFSGAVAGFSDPNGGSTAADHSATIDWGDGQSSAGTITFDPSGHRYTVAGTHNFAEEGSYPVSVTITDAGGASASTSTTATVSDAPLGVGVLPIRAVERTPFSGAVARFTNGDPASRASDHAVTIDWGDGVSSVGVVVEDTGSGQFLVTGDHTYDGEGVYAVRVSVTDTGGAASQASGSVTVAPAAILARSGPISSTAGAPFAGVVATFSDQALTSDPLSFSASIEWGDGQTSAGSIHFDPGANVFVVEGANTYTVEGVYAVRVVIRDRQEAEAVTTSTAVVSDAPLTLTGAPGRQAADLKFTGALATLFDGDPRARLSDVSVSIRWGDGTTTTGSLVADVWRGILVVGDHTFAGSGDQEVLVTVTDRGGSSATARVTVTALPPPGAGTVVAPAPGRLPNGGVTPTTPGLPIFGAGPPVTVPTPGVPISPPGPTAGAGNAAPATIPRGALVSSPTPHATALSNSSPDQAPGPAAAPGVVVGEGASPAAGPPGALQAALNGAVEFLTGRLTGLLGGSTSTTDGLAVRSPLSAPVAALVRQAKAGYTPPSHFLWDELDRLGRQIESGEVAPRVARVLGTGAIAYAGYVLLNGRWGYLLLSLLTAKPLLSQLDPLDVLAAWEDERRRTGGRPAGAGGEDEDETLQSLVDGDPVREDVRTGHDETERGDHQPYRQLASRRAGSGVHSRPRGRRDRGAKNPL